MTNELTTTEGQQDLIQQARANAGLRSGGRIPYVPTITVNNKKTEKIVDGETVEVPAKKGFNLRTRDANGEYTNEYFKDELMGVILKVRYSIQSKQNVVPRYYSFEFDSFNAPVAIMSDGGEQEFIGNYKEIKKHYATGEKNSFGQPKKSFDLIYNLYLDLNGEIYRLRLNNASVRDFIEYSSSFGKDDVFTAYQTNFNLEFHKTGTIKFWSIKFERGVKVDLAKEIELQKELSKFFWVEREARQPHPVEVEGRVVGADEQEIIQAFDAPEEITEDEIKVDQIPF